MPDIDDNIPQDENKLIAERREKLNALRTHGNAFPNDFRPDAFAGDLQARFEGQDAAAIEGAACRVRVAGRLLAKRIMGKASFVQIQDMTGRLPCDLAGRPRRGGRPVPASDVRGRWFAVV